MRPRTQLLNITSCRTRRTPHRVVVASAGGCGTGVWSAAGVFPEVVVGGVGDLGHGACRRRGALRGRWGQAADGCDPLDVAGGHQPVAIRPAAVEAADSRTQAIAVGSTVTTASAWPTTRLPSLAS